MSTATGSFAIEKDAEPIPGYRLEERIGAGGYGEVWRATAPGGLAKAVKIIHGHMDDTRAVRELRGMQRVKSVKHPFLLSLERIEVVDGHLVIVSELADATLADCCKQYQGQGMPGIPRPELLGYMREAADALDHLFDAHGLQHLDVKPENLLLVSKHLKVADFGLLKDLQESCASFVNGLTPKYSAPEVFGGRPGRHSDQYSLAIVYHEMVSGQLPFEGNSFAALASQHLHAVPDLSALAPLERFAVGKALSKDPEHRFPNCQAFVERLSHRGSAAIVTLSPSASPEDAELTSREVSRNNLAAEHVHDGQTMDFSSPEIRRLPRLQPPEGAVKYRPTVLIGIGEMGGRILNKLRQTITDRIGPAPSLPALQFLYIDTDADAIESFSSGSGNEALRQDEILITPLRQTQDYRNSVVSSLDSISRRWIYNVPRTLRTQGIRALGRIALLDHAPRLLDRLRRAVQQCTDSESVAKTSSESGLDFGVTDPRVFVVASIAGGTGGGMVVDVAYAIRQALAECGFADDAVCGILTYSTSRGPSACNFTAANAYACLDELRYFSQPNCDYPGEPQCDLAGFRGVGSTFRSTYLFDFGEELTGEQFTTAIDAVSEYLFLNSVSKSSALFDQCRETDREAFSESLRLRTAGVCPFMSATHEDPTLFAELLCKSVVRKWKVGIQSATSDERIKLSEIGRLYEACDPQDQTSDHIETATQLKLDELHLDLEYLTQRMMQVAGDKLGAEPKAYLRKVICDSLDEENLESTAVSVALKRIRTIIGTDDGQTCHESQIDRLLDLLMPEAKVIGSQLGESLAAWILGLVDTENARVDGARQAVKWAIDHLRCLQQIAVQHVEVAKQELKTVLQSISTQEAKTNRQRKAIREVIAASLQAYAEQLFDVLIRESVSRAMRSVGPSLTSASDQLRELWKELTQLADEFHVSSPFGGKAQDAAGHERVDNGPASMAEVFSSRHKELIEELDRFIAEQLFKKPRRFWEVFTPGNRERSTFADQMRAISRKIIQDACTKSNYAYLKSSMTPGDNHGFSAIVRRCLNSARPDLLDLGAAKRLILVIPTELDAIRLAKEVERISQDQVSVSIESNGDFKICYEVEDLPWQGVQTKFVRQRHDCPTLAARLHTRVNINWSIS